MIQAQQEQSSWEESIPNIEIQKKLYVLHSENERLKSLHEESEVQIKNYVRKISELHNQNYQLVSDNQRLLEQNQRFSKKQVETEKKLQLKTDEYAQLYNFLFVDRKREFRDLVVQEIELNNNLNLMQHRTDGQIIESLKQNLKSRYEEIRNLSQEISKLNEALLDSSWEYQQKICELKNENIKLNVKVTNFEQRMKNLDISNFKSHEQINEIIQKGKFKAYQEQAQLYQKQIELLRKQIAEDKANLVNLEYEKAALIRSLKMKDENNDIHYDFIEFQQMIKENKALKIEIEETKIKYEYLVRESSYLEENQDEIHKYILFKDNNKILKEEKIVLAKQVKRVEKNLAENKQRTERLDNKVTELQLELDNFRTKSVLTIDKLKKVLAVYVPCFNLYGYSGIGFDDSELKEVEDHKYDKENEIARLSKEIKEKINNAGNDRKKIDDLEGKIRKQMNTIQANEVQIEELKKKIEKLSICFKLIKNTKRTTEDPYIFEIDSDEDIDEYMLRQSQPSINKHNNVRIATLQEAILSLHRDRVEMIEIIKERDEMLAKQISKSSWKHPEIKVVNIIQPAKITYRSIQLKVPANLNKNQFIDNSIELNQLKKEIRSLGNKYQKEIELLNIAHENQFLNLKNKYNKIVAEFGELQNLYNILLQKSEEKSIIVSEKDNKEVSQMIEEAENVQAFENILQSNDQNTISEFTIQTISDLLKKYEKQFSRFAVLYESKLSHGTVRGVEEFDQNVDENDRFSVVKRQIGGLQTLLQKNNETINLMETELNEKEELLKEQTKIRQEQCDQLKSKINDLERRLQEAQQVVNDLQMKQISTLSKEDNGQASYESLNTAFVIINSKTVEIDQLKQKNESLHKQLAEKEQQFKQLSDSVFKTDSPLAQKELELLKRVIQQENLPEILQSYLAHLERTSHEMEE